MQIFQIPVGDMKNFSYLVSDKSNNGVYIDPGWEPEKVISLAQVHSIDIKAVLLTHTHYDHAQEGPYVLDRTGADIYLHESAQTEFSNYESQCKLIDEDQVFQIGQLSIQAICTPGHKEDSICYLIDGNLFTGDTLFVDAVGRTDLPGSNPNEMKKSLKKICSLASETVIYPGHDYGNKPKASLAAQMLSNPWLNGQN